MSPLKRIANAGNTDVPAIVALEELGFQVVCSDDGSVTATREDEKYLADDPVAVLGLVKLIEMRTWNWHASDEKIDEVMRRHRLG